MFHQFRDVVTTVVRDCGSVSVVRDCGSVSVVRDCGSVSVVRDCGSVSCSRIAVILPFTILSEIKNYPNFNAKMSHINLEYYLIFQLQFVKKLLV